MCCWKCPAGRLRTARGLVFCVSDSGIGMRQEVLAQLFESFAQGDSSTTRRYGGSGLGLAISKELVEMMNGHIEVQSAPGRGSRFCFEIPLHAASDVEDPLSQLLAGRPALLASQDAQGLEALSHLLRRWGMRTERCQDPERLPDCLADFTAPPLLVLLAPGRAVRASGWNVCARIWRAISAC